MAALRCLVATVLAGCASAGSVERLGSNFPVMRQHTQNDQNQVEAAALPDGFSVTVWRSDRDDQAWQGIYARLYDASGLGLGGPTDFAVCDTPNVQRENPGVAILPDGNIIVTWAEHTDHSTRNRTVKGQILRRRGLLSIWLARVGGELLLSPETDMDGDWTFSDVGIAPLPEGFAVSYARDLGAEQGEEMQLVVRTFSSSGALVAVGMQPLVSENKWWRRSLMLRQEAAGTLLVSFLSSVYRVSVQGTAASFAPVVTGLKTSISDFAVFSNGDFVIIGGSQATVQRYSSSGGVVGGSFDVAGVRSFDSRIVKLRGSEAFVVAVEDDANDGHDLTSSNVFVQAFYPDGNPVNPTPLQANDFDSGFFSTTYQQGFPALVAVQDARFTVFWATRDHIVRDIGGGFGIFGQRYEVTL